TIVSPAQSIVNALGLLGRGEYDLFSNNCEAFATFCKTHQVVSAQVFRVAVVSCIGMIVGAASDGLRGAVTGALAGPLTHFLGTGLNIDLDLSKVSQPAQVPPILPE